MNLSDINKIAEKTNRDFDVMGPYDLMSLAMELVHLRYLLEKTKLYLEAQRREYDIDYKESVASKTIELSNINPTSKAKIIAEKESIDILRLSSDTRKKIDRVAIVSDRIQEQERIIKKKLEFMGNERMNMTIAN
jgi:hypothetical protein